MKKTNSTSNNRPDSRLPLPSTIDSVSGKPRPSLCGYNPTAKRETKMSNLQTIIDLNKRGAEVEVSGSGYVFKMWGTNSSGGDILRTKGTYPSEPLAIDAAEKYLEKIGV